MKVKAILATVLLAATSGAMACQNTSAVEAFGKRLDKNKDGQISLHEWKHMSGVKAFERDFNRGSLKTFHTLDTNGDRKLSMKELAALSGRVTYKNAVECSSNAPSASSQSNVVPVEAE
ncbi:EF-hand domain-containing protein [Wielerella bovis]|uniref:EF-hand domain-containing protein n=1 Tax=Wielerella bovis TaxID=2917790 RepID=UPI0020188361|nr:EF-hand domain-containing protein [Wielerella bovis]ULJ60530.1 EF-hand domain-containing protein [Wielerella bovis]ULJ64969.1 EF-hand domain-containing protein [Wielerella bovis]ULJ67242.1 EF-hand domain-containing protein [Wielerella bovis]